MWCSLCAPWWFYTCTSSAYEQNSWMFAALGGDATFSCSTCCSTSEWLSGEIRSQANPPPFSLHLSLQSPLSCCLLAPSICRPLFVLCQTYVYERERQREMHGCILCLYIDLISACLSSLIAFHPSPPSSLTAFFPISPSLRSYLWWDYEAYHGISETRGMY